MIQIKYKDMNPMGVEEFLKWYLNNSTERIIDLLCYLISWHIHEKHIFEQELTVKEILSILKIADKTKVTRN